MSAHRWPTVTSDDGSASLSDRSPTIESTDSATSRVQHRWVKRSSGRTILALPEKWAASY